MIPTSLKTDTPAGDLADGAEIELLREIASRLTSIQTRLDAVEHAQVEQHEALTETLNEVQAAVDEVATVLLDGGTADEE